MRASLEVKALPHCAIASETGEKASLLFIAQGVTHYCSCVLQRTQEVCDLSRGIDEKRAFGVFEGIAILRVFLFNLYPACNVHDMLIGVGARFIAPVGKGYL